MDREIQIIVMLFPGHTGDGKPVAWLRGGPIDLWLTVNEKGAVEPWRRYFVPRYPVPREG